MEAADRQQDDIVRRLGGSALVLAGPGCGKTHILARRVAYAYIEHDIPFEEMLCVTFTNRAAREMTRRISSALGTYPHGLFVGNIHRFCLRFLYENGIIPPDTTVLDEDDRLEYLAGAGIIRAGDVKTFLAQAAWLYQTRHDHPEWILRRPSVPPSSADLAAIEAYAAFKSENRLIDFDDILLMTYTALQDHPAGTLRMTGYRWVQVDEVQDMTPLQLALVEKVSSTPDRTCLYLGDEQQAIFSFTGAGGRALDAVKRVCRDSVLNLRRNYRSPRYLVELCNNIATAWLGIPASLLPDAVREDSTTDPLTFYTASEGHLRIMAAAMARRFLAENPGESVLILTHTNAQGDDMAYALRKLGLEHFHVSRADVFHQPAFKTIRAHLAAINGTAGRFDWATLLYRTGAIDTLTGARALVRRMRDCAIGPDELLSEGSRRVERFAAAMTDADTTVAVLDTETTGLDIFTDDVVQFAAVKMRGGKIVPGSEFDIFIESDRSLPRTLSDGTPNPLIDTYANAPKAPRREALALIADYLADADAVCGHNIGFDTAILRECARRAETPELTQALTVPEIDTLRIARLLMPGLKSHTLGFLTELLCELKDTTYHNALADVQATAELCRALLPTAKSKLAAISDFDNERASIRIASRFRRYYGDFYHSRLAQLLQPGGTLGQAIADAHSFFTATGAIEPIEVLGYICELADKYICEPTTEPNLRDQLAAHIYDLMTYSESDLFANGIVRERLSVMTVHKAKGLEADNVIVLDARRTFGSFDDRVRLLYVAFSRARRRLAVGMSGSGRDEIVGSVLRHFRTLDRFEIAGSINKELMNYQDEEEELKL